MPARFSSSSQPPYVSGMPVPGVDVPSLDCPVCDHANPAGARYCNNCGAPVHLIACPRCDAVNDPESGFCYKCHASLAGRTSAEREPQPVAPEPLPRDTADDANDGVLMAEPARPELESATILGPDDAHPVLVQRTSIVERAATSEVTQPSGMRHSGWAVALLLFVLAIAGLAALAHYRPEAIDRGIAAARSTLGFSASAPGTVTPHRNAAAEIAGTIVSRPPPSPATSTAPATVVTGATRPPDTSSPPTAPAVTAAEAPATRPTRGAPESAPVRSTARAPSDAAPAPASTATRSATPRSGGVRTSAGAVASNPISTSALDRGREREATDSRPATCTEGVIALGLCTTEPRSTR